MRLRHSGAVCNEDLGRIIEDPDQEIDDREDVKREETVEGEEAERDATIATNEGDKTIKSTAGAEVVFVLAVADRCKIEVASKNYGVNTTDGINWLEAVNDGDAESKRHNGGPGKDMF